MYYFSLLFANTGTSANMANMQMYLLEGVSRWNINRRASARLTSAECFDIKLLTAVNDLSREILDKTAITFCQKPAKYTGKIFSLLC